MRLPLESIYAERHADERRQTNRAHNAAWGTTSTSHVITVSWPCAVGEPGPKPEEVGAEFSLVGFVHLFLFSFVILELFNVQNLLVDFVDSLPDWSEMALG